LEEINTETKRACHTVFFRVLILMHSAVYDKTHFIFPSTTELPWNWYGFNCFPFSLMVSMGQCTLWWTIHTGLF